MRSTRIDLAALLLRLTVGGLMLFHGYSKISQGFEKGTGFVKDQILGKGLGIEESMAQYLAYGVYAGELLAPAMLILGIFVPLAGFMVSATMAVAIYLAHAGDLTSLGTHGSYALEVQTFFLVGGICCALLGCGRFGLMGGRDKGPIGL